MQNDKSVTVYCICLGYIIDTVIVIPESYAITTVILSARVIGDVFMKPRFDARILNIAQLAHLNQRLLENEREPHIFCVRYSILDIKPPPSSILASHSVNFANPIDHPPSLLIFCFATRSLLFSSSVSPSGPSHCALLVLTRNFCRRCLSLGNHSSRFAGAMAPKTASGSMASWFINAVFMLGVYVHSGKRRLRSRSSSESSSSSLVWMSIRWMFSGLGYMGEKLVDVGGCMVLLVDFGRGVLKRACWGGFGWLANGILPSAYLAMSTTGARAGCVTVVCWICATGREGPACRLAGGGAIG